MLVKVVPLSVMVGMLPSNSLIAFNHSACASKSEDFSGTLPEAGSAARWKVSCSSLPPALAIIMNQFEMELIICHDDRRATVGRSVVVTMGVLPFVGVAVGIFRVAAT